MTIGPMDIRMIAAFKISLMHADIKFQSLAHTNTAHGIKRLCVCVIHEN